MAFALIFIATLPVTATAVIFTTLYGPNVGVFGASAFVAAILTAYTIYSVYKRGLL